MEPDAGSRARIGTALLAGLLVAAAVFALLMALSADPFDRRATEQPEVDTYTAGRAVFVRMGCGDCHRLAAGRSRGGIGPDLDEGLERYTHDALVAQIVDPYPQLGPGEHGVMPRDFGRRLSQGELDDLASFLLSAAKAPGAG